MMNKKEQKELMHNKIAEIAEATGKSRLEIAREINKRIKALPGKIKPNKGSQTNKQE